ncbi:unnamed protein product [Clonostachys byssicola]|uniref:Heterokaryon incompatibility domain-containing protein n=1 Tax=Clonostachys byssicola TaxID=160290 RepID=A0A9N9Y0L1_9HYPO|nr:unnamed protein product [Clonostachys byssicola]
MLCTICREALTGIWDPSQTKRVCGIKEFNENFPQDDSKTRIPLPTAFIDTNQHPSQYMFGHHLTLESYNRSVAQGCVLCCRSGHGSQDIDQTILGYFSLFNIDLGKTNPIMGIFKSRVYTGGLSLTVFNASTQDFNLEVSPSTGDASTLALVQRWVDTCVQSHQQCSQTTPFIPQYLLQLDDTNGLFHLASADQIDPQTRASVRYCTLSHCHRFEENSLHLTTSTLETLSRPQSLSTLPLIYRDAFTVVARLGLRHLWVDHLCIPQDRLQSHSHEEVENVFSNSFCGIGAMGSAVPSSGLFVKRKAELVVPTILELQLDADGTKGLGLRERLLTPRMVHFASSLVYWKCHGARCSEISPENMVLLLKSYQGLVQGSNKDADLVLPQPAWKPIVMVLPLYYARVDPQAYILDRWFNLLRTSTQCTATAPEQRLNCVDSAVVGTKAQLREHGCDDTYLAGMWKATLPKALVWTVEGVADRRPTEFQGPSWSWAAVHGVIRYDNRKMEGIVNGGLCELIDANCTSNEINSVISGRLTLKGKLLTGKLAYDDYNDYGLPQYVLTARYGTQMNVLELKDGNSGGCLVKAPEDAGHLYEWYIRFDTEEDMKKQAQTVLLPICLTPTLNQTREVYMYGMALFKLESGVYTRCGMWQVLMPSEQDARGLLQVLPESEITTM